MTEVDQGAESVDGRAARRQRNIELVLDVVLDMFAEDSSFPTIEQAAARSGLSLRSLYRYFSDPGELVEATIKHSQQRTSGLTRLHAIGEGPLERRIEDFVAMRLRLHEAVGPVFRATNANAARHPRIRAEQAKNRGRLRQQFERQFEPELAELTAAERHGAVNAGDVLTQLDSIDYLRRLRELTVAEAHEALATALRSLLT
ncbi:MAG: TetR/AcrR family transcriptional regulator [Actinomycetota bacterium]